MDTDARTASILAMILDIWSIHGTPEFGEYLRSITAEVIGDRIDFEGFCVQEMSEGNTANGDLFPPSARSWIMNDIVGCQQISYSEAFDLLSAQTKIIDGIEFREIPWIRFYLDGDMLILGQTFGPEVIARQLCRVSFESGKCRIVDKRTAWTFDTLGK